MIRDQSGMSLVELIIATALMLVLLGASLTIFNGFEQTTRSNESLNDSLERSRVAIDQLARELRNGTTPSPEQPAAIEKADKYDLVTQTVSDTLPAGSSNTRNVRRVRYCLDAGTDNGQLYYQTQTWTGSTPPAVPSTTSCPDPAWGNQRVVADRIVNRRDASNVWTFNSASLNLITRIRMELIIDINSEADRPRATRLASAVFMRNQNQPPVAAFQVTKTGNNTLHLNATPSADPENERLTYEWYDNGSLISKSGIAVSYAPSVGTHVIKLKVYDPSGLYGTSEQTVTIS